MSEHHDPSHEAFLAGLLSGERRLDDPHSQSELARCARCRQEWMRLAALASDLGLATIDPEELESAARASTATEGTDVVRSQVRELARKQAPAARRSSAWKWVLAAAAALLVFLFARSAWQDSGPPSEDVLLGAVVELEHPIGVVNEYPPFAWSTPRPAAIEYEVLVWNSDDAPEASPRARSSRLRAARWTPGPSDLSGLSPAGIRWVVRGYDGQGNCAVEVEGSAQLGAR